MGKRYLLLAIAALLMVQSAFAAITVTPNAPENDMTQSSPNVSFNCDAAESDPNYEISNISLYIDAVKNYTQSGVSLVTVVLNLAAGSHTWYCEGVNNASVSASSSARTFTISAANTAPNFTGTIPNQTFDEDTTLSNAFDLDTYFQDTSALTYTASGNTHITVSIASDGWVSFSSTANWSGSELIRFTATDTGSLTNTSNYVNVSVTPVNDAPYYTTIPTQNMTKNTNLSLNLNSFFFDVEGSTLNFTISTAPSHMNVTIISGIVVFSPEPNWTGSTTVAFAAFDGDASTTGNTFTLLINGTSTNATANRPPTLSCPLGRTGLIAGESATFTITKSDPDGDTLTVQWKIGSEVVDGETGDSYSFSKSESGFYTLKAIVSDGKEERECSWVINVTSAADLNYTSEALDIASIIADQTEEVARCGDSKIQEGETCANCPADVVCKAGEVCSNGVCVLKTSSLNVLIVIGIIIAVILGGGFVVYKLTTRRKVETTVRDGRTLAKIEKELPPIDLHDIYEKEEKPKADTHRIPAPHENPLHKYVRQQREKGVSDNDIREALKSKGWNDSQISDAMK